MFGIFNLPDHNRSSTVVNLFANQNREVDVIGGSDFCPHVAIEENRCKGCGAYVGFFGSETDPDLFYKHAWAYVSRFSGDVFLVSHRIIPYEYSHKLSKLKKNHFYRSVVWLDREKLFVNAFTKNQVYDVFQSVTTRKIPYLLSRVSEDVLWVNPTKIEADTLNVDFYFPTKVIE